MCVNIPTSLEAVAVIVLLFIPGYIFLQFTRGAVAFVPQNTDARYFFAVITWGGLIHLAFFWRTRDILDWYLEKSLDEHELATAVWAFVVLVLAPLGIGLFGSWVIKQEKVDRALSHIGMDYISRTPSAWNYVTKLGPRWVRIHLKDGTIIGGTYDQGAFADDVGEKDLYLSRVYNLDENGDFDQEVPFSAGVWITHGEISHIMFYHPSTREGASDDQQPGRYTEGHQDPKAGA
jgi:hypothetical protein